jgi:hypothetical protein
VRRDERDVSHARTIASSIKEREESKRNATFVELKVSWYVQHALLTNEAECERPHARVLSRFQRVYDWNLERVSPRRFPSSEASPNAEEPSDVSAEKSVFAADGPTGVIESLSQLSLTARASRASSTSPIRSAMTAREVDAM